MKQDGISKRSLFPQEKTKRSRRSSEMIFCIRINAVFQDTIEGREHFSLQIGGSNSKAEKTDLSQICSST